MATPEEFHRAFMQDVYRLAEADGDWASNTFFLKFGEALEEVGALSSADAAHYYKEHQGIRVDGYGGDPIDSDNVLCLIISDFDQSTELKTLQEAEMARVFGRLEKFLVSALDSKFRTSLEDAHGGADLAELIAARWQNLSKIELFIISNRTLSARVDGRQGKTIEGVPVEYNVWDMDRLHRYTESGGGREEMVIDLADYGGWIPVLTIDSDNEDYKAYLGKITGPQLAAIYGRWRARLLEQNVRLFLQFRGAVNRGIRSTLENEPHMFFAYNNGITTTADSVETVSTPEGVFLTKITNFQIVNGGQTTAAIFAASKNISIALDQVAVQMKLNIVDPEKSIRLVENISKFANSQNRVSDADFFSNHPFHIEFANMSRRIYAQSGDGTFRDSKWFYERARGQYQEARAYLTPAQQRAFDMEYPKPQLISKTDLGKFLNVWEFKPDLVSKGAQINFSSFASEIIKRWDDDRNFCSEEFFRRSIAKDIIFKGVEKLVPKQAWYEGGYRANIVAYSIAKLAYDINQLNMVFDFSRVWRDQAISKELTEVLAASAEAVHKVITDPPSNLGNRSEWAKRAACWERVKALTVEWPEPLENHCTTKKEDADQLASGKKDQQVVNGIEAQTFVVSTDSSIWLELIEWESSKEILTPPERSSMKLASNGIEKVPSDRHCRIAVECVKKLADQGCQVAIDLFDGGQNEQGA